MITIKARFDDGDGLKGYIVDEDGLIQYYSMRGLYEYDIMQKLIAAGYKYYDYYGNIELPDGSNVVSLPIETVSLSNNDKALIVELEEIAEDEASCVRYFNINLDETVEEIQFKSPDNPTIKTREEFINYLDTIHASISLGCAIDDVRPLNSFVAKEALFTIEECVENPDYFFKYLEIIDQRRILQNYSAFEALKKNLVDQGVLSSVNASEGEILDAYYAWGVCGLNFGYISKEMYKNDSRRLIDVVTYSSFFNKTDNDKEDLVYGVLCDGKLYARNKEILINEDGEHPSIEPVNERPYYLAVSRVNMGSSEFEAVKVRVKDTRDILYYSILTKDGVRLNLAIDRYEIRLYQEHMAMIPVQSNFKIKDIIGSLCSPFEFDSALQYKLYNLSLAKASAMIKNITVEPLFKNSYQFLINRGLSPSAAMMYMAARVYDGAKEFSNEKLGFSDLNYASHVAPTYFGGIPEPVYSKYADDVTPEDFDDYDDFIRYIVDAKEEATQGKETKSDSFIPNLFDILDFINIAYFGLTCKNGAFSIDALYEGLVQDSGDNLYNISDILVSYITAITKSRNVQTGLEQKMLMIDSVDTATNKCAIDFSDILKVRDRAMAGNKIDLVYLDSQRFTQAKKLFWVTRVFREYGNKPVNELNHFMFESLVVDMTDDRAHKFRKEIITAVREYINQHPEMIVGIDNRDILNHSIGMIAGNIFSKIAFTDERMVTEGERSYYTYTETIYDVRYTFELDVDSRVYRAFKLAAEQKEFSLLKIQYATLYDYAYYQRGMGQYFYAVCMNARITPWRVIPNNGVKIYSYPLNVNIIGLNNLEAMPKLKARALENNAVCFNQPLISYLGRVNLLFEPPELPDYRLASDDIDIDYVESYIKTPGEVETLKTYLNRWRYYESKAPEGKYLVSIPLQSDYIYKGFGNYYGYYPEQEVKYADDPDGLHQHYMKLHLDVFPLTSTDINTFEIESRVVPFKLSEQDPLLVSGWDAFLNNRINYDYIVALTGYFLYVTNKKTGQIENYDLNTIELSQLRSLADRGLIYQMNANDFIIIVGKKKYIVKG